MVNCESHVVNVMNYSPTTGLSLDLLFKPISFVRKESCAVICLLHVFC